MKEDPFAFVKWESYSEDMFQPILDFMVEFISKYILLEDEDSDGEDLEPAPFICVFDNAYFLDLPSWHLIERIKLQCERISFILICKTDELG